MIYQYKPQGVCARGITFEVEHDVVKSVRFEGGCAGNAVGIARLAEGRPVKDIIGSLKGIPCGGRPTSCPDQLARALEKTTNQ